jgi:hypothetical protein
LSRPSPTKDNLHSRSGVEGAPQFVQIGTQRPEWEK